MAGEIMGQDWKWPFWSHCMQIWPKLPTRFLHYCQSRKKLKFSNLQTCTTLRLGGEEPAPTDRYRDTTVRWQAGKFCRPLLPIKCILRSGDWGWRDQVLNLFIEFHPRQCSHYSTPNLLCGASGRGKCECFLVSSPSSLGSMAAAVLVQRHVEHLWHIQLARNHPGYDLKFSWPVPIYCFLLWYLTNDHQVWIKKRSCFSKYIICYSLNIIKSSFHLAAPDVHQSLGTLVVPSQTADHDHLVAAPLCARAPAAGGRPSLGPPVDNAGHVCAEDGCGATDHWDGEDISHQFQGPIFTSVEDTKSMDDVWPPPVKIKWIVTVRCQRDMGT